MSTAAEKRNLRVGLIAGGLAVAMVGAAYASVPLYYAFCRATGLNGTTQVASQGAATKGLRTLSVRFGHFNSSPLAARALAAGLPVSKPRRSPRRGGSFHNRLAPVGCNATGLTVSEGAAKSV